MLLYLTMKLGKYLHSKSGKKYEVIGLAHHSEDLSELVVYRALYDSKEFGNNALCVRPKQTTLNQNLPLRNLE